MVCNRMRGQERYGVVCDEGRDGGEGGCGHPECTCACAAPVRRDLVVNHTSPVSVQHTALQTVLWSGIMGEQNRSENERR